MPSPTAVQIELSLDEREMLEAWTRRRTSAAALSLRSRIVLAACGGESNTEIARRLGVHRNTVALWRRRFVESRLDGLLDEPRPGAAAQGHRCSGRGGDHPDAGERAEGRDALVDALDGQGGRALADRGLEDLAGVWAATTPP